VQSRRKFLNSASRPAPLTVSWRARRACSFDRLRTGSERSEGVKTSHKPRLALFNHDFVKALGPGSKPIDNRRGFWYDSCTGIVFHVRELPADGATALRWGVVPDVKDVKSASRVLDVFELLARDPQGMSLKQISQSVHVPPSSCHALLQTLQLARPRYLIPWRGKPATRPPATVVCKHAPDLAQARIRWDGCER